MPLKKREKRNRVTELNRDFLRNLREEVEGVLSDPAGKHGLEFKLGRCTFTPNNATFKLEVSVVDPEGNAISGEREAFLKIAPTIGLKPEDMDRVFVSQGRRYRIVGLSTRAYKRPILAERDDGQRFKFTVESVRKLLR